MSVVIVPHRNGTTQPAGNGTKPARITALSEHARLRALAPIRTQVDQLASLRALLKQAEQAERELTLEILAALRGAGLTRFEGHRAIAVVGERTTLEVDPELFLHATGSAGFEAVHVKVSAARHLLAEDDILAISEVETTSVLRVEPLSPPKASA